MGEIHDALELHGKQAVLRMEPDRKVVEAAAAYMAEEGGGINFVYSGWCQAALPHKRLPDDEGWQIRSDYVNLVVQPGLRPTSSGPAQRIGIPYGSRARLIMIYVQSEALRTKSRDVNLGRSMNQWLHRMGIPLGGKSIHSIRDQALRINHCSFRFETKGTKRIETGSMTIFEKALLQPIEEVDGQGNLFPQIARLSVLFYEQLTAHPVPLEEAAIRAISNNSMALDIYAWLAYRLHVLKAPMPITWTALKGQFGVSYDLTKHFRPAFIDNLKLALAVYRDAKVEVNDDGIELFPSRPPVAPRQFSVGRVLSLRP